RGNQLRGRLRRKSTDDHRRQSKRSNIHDALYTLRLLRPRLRRTRRTTNFLPGNGRPRHRAVGVVGRGRLKQEPVAHESIEALLRTVAIAANTKRTELVVDDVAVHVVDIERAEVVGVGAQVLPGFLRRRLRRGVRLSVWLNHMHGHEARRGVNDVAGLAGIRASRLTLVDATFGRNELPEADELFLLGRGVREVGHPLPDNALLIAVG